MINIKLVVLLSMILSIFIIENIKGIYNQPVLHIPIKRNKVKSNNTVNDKLKDPYPHPISTTTSTHSGALYGSPLI